MKKLVLSILSLMVISISFASNTILDKVYFAKAADTFTVSEIDKNVLQGNLFYLKGYADSEGDEDYNLDLSKRRVEAVKTYLLTQGIHEQNIHTSFLGEREGESVNDMKENRVVEITYLIDPLMQHQVKKQEFPIVQDEENIITGKHGTVVTIPAGAFIEKDVVITMKEYYNPLEIMSANLSTVSNGKNLESGGMLYIEAKRNGVNVTPTKDVEFSFAAEKEKDDFELFTGEVGKDLNVNWQSVNPEDDVVVQPSFSDRSATSWFGWYTFDYLRAGESLFLANTIGNKLFTTFGKSISDGKYQLVLATDGSVSISKMEFSQATDAEFIEIEKTIKEVIDSQNFKTAELECELVVDLGDVTDANILDYAVQTDEAFASNTPSATQSTTTSTTTSTNTSVMKTRRLGWINCDRYLANKNLVDFKVKVGAGVNVRMIVKEYKSYFNSSVVNGMYSFSRIPKNEDVFLVAVVKMNDQYLLAIEDVVTSKEVFTDFNFEAYSYEEMIEKLGEIKL